jgi:FtsH-binding integral membrane protein
MNNSAVYSEDGKRVSVKFMAVVFLYMFLGLLITALSGFLFAFWLANSFAGPNKSGLTDQGEMILIFSMIGAWIVALVDSIAMPFVSRKTGKAPWIGYILYALCIGIGFSFLLLAGFSYQLIGEAFGLTALVFLAMFLVGYFAKVNLSPLAFVGISLLLGVFLVSLFWGVFIWIAGYTATLLFDYLISLVIIVAMMLFIAYDANRMAQIAEQGMTTTNTALYCAFQLYGDFIVLFVRILYVLLATRSRN